MKKNILISAFACVCICLLINSCNKGSGSDGESVDPAELPTISTNLVTHLTKTTALSGGEVISEGDSPIISLGVCWATHENPTVDDERTLDAEGAATFISNIGELEENTAYYARAYAKTSKSTAYGNQVQFTTLSGDAIYGSFVDPRDDKVYEIVKIGTQIWFAQNLAYVTENYKWPNDNENVGEEYGKLYTWNEAMDACPAGWKLPSNSDWENLEREIGVSSSELDILGCRANGRGATLKSTEGWAGNGNGFNNYGFNAFPAGSFYNNGDVYGFSTNAYFWSSTSSSSTRARARGLEAFHSKICQDDMSKENVFSVRCMKNVTVQD